MKIMSFLFMGSWMLATFGCYQHYVPITQQDRELEGISRLVRKNGASFAKERSLWFCGSGCCIDFCRLSYQVKGSITQAAIRELIIECAESRLSDINSYRTAQTCLSHYPFTEEDIGITIFVNDQDWGSIFHPYICMAALRSGQITYTTKDPDPDKPYKFDDIYSESYAEAKEKVTGTQRGDPNTNGNEVGSTTSS